jgi:hypothetical protein
MPIKHWRSPSSTPTRSKPPRRTRHALTSSWPRSKPEEPARQEPTEVDPRMEDRRSRVVTTVSRFDRRPSASRRPGRARLEPVVEPNMAIHGNLQSFVRCMGLPSQTDFPSGYADGNRLGVGGEDLQSAPSNRLSNAELTEVTLTRFGRRAICVPASLAPSIE